MAEKTGGALTATNNITTLGRSRANCIRQADRLAAIGQYANE